MYYDNNVNVELDDGLNKFVAKIYGWMFTGLLTTALIALALVAGIYSVPVFRNFVISFIDKGIFILPIAELVLVLVLSAKINSMKSSTAKIMFLVYSIMNGITIGIICLGFGLFTVYKAFLMTSLMFGAMSLYGYKTKSDLTKAGNLFKMALIGLIIVSLINLFMKSRGLDWAISIIGMAVFLGLTAYDTKKIKQFYYNIVSISDTATISKVAIIGALELYLDFINLFLYVLRIFGRRSN